MEKLVCIQDFEEAAYKVLNRNALDYYKSGADDEVTLRENKAAFKRWIIKPKMLVDVSKRSTETMVLGKPVSFPLGVSPTAMQKLAHEEGEMANARAAQEMGTIFILSTISTSSVEEVAEAAPNGRKWFQLYVYKDRKLSESLVQRAEKAGFEALVLTVDAPYFGKRRANIRNKFNLPPHLKMANFSQGSDASEGVSKFFEGSAINSYIDRILDQSLTWKDVAWLKRITKLPIIVKGILTREDAALAIQHGVTGIFVSNHGARQLDTVSPTIDALSEIVDEVQGRAEIYLDGGVTSGSDVFKAISLGANMVFAGRPLLWGLTLAGEMGAKKVLQIFLEELDLTMALSGTPTIERINRGCVERYWPSNL